MIHPNFIPKFCFQVAQFIAFFEPLKHLDMGNIKFSEKYSNKFVRALDKNFNMDFVDLRCCSKISSKLPDLLCLIPFLPDFSEDNKLKVKVLLARNKHLKENPLLKKPTPWTKEEELAAEEWLKSEKQPLFVKNQEIYRKNLEKMEAEYDLWVFGI